MNDRLTAQVPAASSPDKIEEVLQTVRQREAAASQGQELMLQLDLASVDSAQVTTAVL